MKTKVCILSLMSLLMASSCDITHTEPDGLWTPMKWNNKNKDIKHSDTEHAYLVPAEGAECMFVCSNYKSPWISDITFQTDSTTEIWREMNNMEEMEDYDFWHIGENEWCSVRIAHDTLNVLFSANEGTSSRLVSLSVTAGDIFHSFRFKQLATSNQ